MNAFFIVGVQRAGTTLLSKMMSQHPEILMEPKSVGFRMITGFSNLYDLLPLNLQHDKNEFIAWLIENDTDGRLAQVIDYQNVENYESVRDLIRGSIEKKVAKAAKTVWGDKSPNLQHYLDDLLLLIPDVKILHIVRDGRANAYSMSRRSYQHLSLSAQKWVDGNIFGIVNQRILGAKQYKMIRYEDLLSNPEKTGKEICQFLNIIFNTQMLQLSGSQLEQPESYVKNFFDASKIDNWKKQLNSKQIHQIEEIQGPLLKEMKYELATATNDLNFRPVSLFRQIRYNQQDNIKQLFRRKRIGMKDFQMVELNIPFKVRVKTFFRVLVRDIFSLAIFKKYFSRIFYKEKLYQPKKRYESN